MISCSFRCTNAKVKITVCTAVCTECYAGYVRILFTLAIWERWSISSRLWCHTVSAGDLPTTCPSPKIVAIPTIIGSDYEGAPANSGRPGISVGRRFLGSHAFDNDVRLVAIAVALTAVIGLSPFIPDRWFNRMNAICNYGEDGLAMSRFYAWQVVWRIAFDSPFVGGGFRVIAHDDDLGEIYPEILLWSWKHRNQPYSECSQHLFSRPRRARLFGILSLYGSYRIDSAIAQKHSSTGQALANTSWLANYSYMVETSFSLSWRPALL